MSTLHEIHQHGLLPTQTEEHREICRQKHGRMGRKSIGVYSTSLLLLIIPLRLWASPLVSPGGEVVARCEDRAEVPSSEEEQRGDDCTPSRTEKLQKEYQDRDTTKWWERFQWGPQAMNEQELRFLYRPGERRPLWGY